MARLVAANVSAAASQPKAPFLLISARYPSFASCVAIASGGTSEARSGINPSQASTPPATSTPAILGPMIYPTPIYSGVIAPLMVAAGNTFEVALVTYPGVSAMTFKICCKVA